MASSKVKRPTKKAKSLPMRSLATRQAKDIKGGAYQAYVTVHFAKQGKSKGETIKE